MRNRAWSDCNPLAPIGEPWFLGAMLSIVIPTLNAAHCLPDTLRALGGPGMDQEIIIADGGSDDRTPDHADALGARVIAAPRGRGAQLRAGAEAASGDWLLFLHADTRLDAGWKAEANAFMDANANRERAGYFRFALDDDTAPARRLETYVAWRCRMFALPYGDQGLLMARNFYDALGGFAPVPLMEDVDMVRRLGRGRLVGFETRAVTSAERYRREGYARRGARNLMCLALYFAGVAPERLVRWYG